MVAERLPITERRREIMALPAGRITQAAAQYIMRAAALRIMQALELRITLVLVLRTTRAVVVLRITLAAVALRTPRAVVRAELLRVEEVKRAVAQAIRRAAAVIQPAAVIRLGRNSIPRGRWSGLPNGRVAPRVLRLQHPIAFFGFLGV